MTAELRIGDVFAQTERLAAEGVTVDLIVTSPPFLALRSYLPADHPDKPFEIGSEPTPAAFLDTLLRLVAALDRVLAPHGSLVFELGDTYAGSGGAGGDYGPDGMRGGQEKFTGSALKDRKNKVLRADGNRLQQGHGWPLDKSLCGIPTLFAWSLAYGRNLLTGEPSPAGQWRIRNVIPWCRPNPPVGALGDKWRPATSYVTVACRARDRWFDLDAVRTPLKVPDATGIPRAGTKLERDGGNRGTLGDYDASMSAGAPPLDWYYDPTVEHQPDDGMWIIPTQPYSGSHYATWPKELVRRLIECMCPREVCRQCGTPRRRITSEPEYVRDGQAVEALDPWPWGGNEQGRRGDRKSNDGGITRTATTLGWTDCGCGAGWRPGLVLDPFGGSCTTLEVASGLGRDSIGFDLDRRNADLALDRVGPLLLTVDYGEAVA